MKKRLKGLLALCIVACMAFAGTTGIVSAAGTGYTIDEINGSQKLYPGDTVNGTVSGGSFVVVDSSGEVISAGDKEVFLGNNNVSGLKCYGDGDEYTIPALPSGYEYYNGEKGDWVDSNMQPYRDKDKNKIITLYLKPVPITYTIVYDANGGSGAVENATFTVEELGNLSDGKAVTKDGVGVKSWNTKKDGSGTAYKPGAAVPKDLINGADAGKNITLYAQWSDADKSPATGDSWTPALLVLMIIGVAGAGIVTLRRKRA